MNQKAWFIEGTVKVSLVSIAFITRTANKAETVLPNAFTAGNELCLVRSLAVRHYADCIRLKSFVTVHKPTQ